MATETLIVVSPPEEPAVLEPISTKDVLSGLDGVFPMDEAVVEALPQGSTFLSAEPFGTSAWTVTGKVMAREPDGTEKAYFLKIAYGEHGGVMLKGEFESAKEIYRLMPGFIPQPFAYGRYKVSNPVPYFYLSEFIDMDITTAPDPGEFATKLAELHKKSESPTGKFGFHVVTCDGKMPHTVDWQDSWAVFFGRLLQGICKIDRETNGPWPEMERATEQLITKVIPRLLGNLRHDGEPIKPCIIHGDLWEPNLGINLETGELMMYDVGSYYAHNEMDLGQWRADFCSHLRSPIYPRQYLRHYPAAEPAEEFDDRNRLYSLKGTINYSAGHPGCIVRQTAYNNMCYLCEKYAPIDGIDKYDPQKDPSVTGARLVPTFTKPDDEVSP
ncbi:Fructosamine kinase-domain-containing protein [Phialemonium atrogriseum]|uniref:protein-ribulosamine 3-kinase n=1 Tax=Phialemonium atrogriseum TaxID=1093897 RepID=A0AAJ0FD55_9PEZI|nr:Fructosamine kinase-domain-containing protein [Phialemonium atrogriseum]KAK1764261.1 Fructosamine kinase-domain-containing protein [Phialemonium atrogriseum]